MLPIQSGQRTFNLVASDGTFSTSTSVTVATSPVARDDVYLLLGQSNMVGFSEEGAKRSGPSELDEPNLRIRQANVQANVREFYPNALSYTDIATNFLSPEYVTAEDPLHAPVNQDTLGKEGTRIGLGMSFVRACLLYTSPSPRDRG